MDYLLLVKLVGGLIYLLMGADLLVRGTVSFASRLRISPIIVATTVVGFGTSLPELVVAVRATLTDHAGIVMGNVVGSNITNIFVVGGAAALVYPLSRSEMAGRTDAIIMVLASVLFLALGLDGELGRSDALVLLAGVALVLAHTAKTTAQQARKADGDLPIEWKLGLPTRIWMISLFIGVGLVGLPLGARLVVDSAVDIAVHLGVTDAFVGLTIVAFSTSLPELATTVIAAYQKRSELMVGTILGSNTFNLLLLMGIAASMSGTPIAVSDPLLRFDIPVMLIATLVFAGFVLLRVPPGRRTGAALVSAYAAYILALVFTTVRVG